MHRDSKGGSVKEGSDEHVNAQRRQQKLSTKREQKSLELQDKLDGWFKEYDLNDNGELDRAELTQLLLFLHPEHPPDDALLDMLIERATAVESYSLQLRGSKDGVVSRMAAEKTIQRHDAYIRQKETLDGIFTKHDKDFSGNLDREEVLSMMNEIITKTKGFMHITATEGDVEYLMASCDTDGDTETVSREELLPALALWKELAQQKDATEKQLLKTRAPSMRRMKTLSNMQQSASTRMSRGMSSFFSTGGDAADEGGSKACVIS